ncbi:MAG: DoxX family protein, partial [Lacibacter sp.]|nr:DoxX family protein [Lacibacter sp.]
MNKSLTVSRWFVGILFIFSGLVKANDPLGLSYKMQEFFEAWGLQGFHDYTLTLSVLMNAFEIIAGVAVIIGWRMKLFSWLLLLLIIFFTFLTGYAWLAKNADGTAKFASCGCFGDCLPLTPVQSFLKDILLLLLIGVIFLNRNKIQPLFKAAWLNVFKIAAAVIFAFGLQWYTLKYLPVVDCLPFKKGNNIVELRKLPADAVPDKYEYEFVYEKGGKQQSFSMKNLPDSTWKFVDRKQTLVAKGKNNEPKIKDFDLKNIDGADVSSEILEQKGTYYLLFLQNFYKLNASDEWVKHASELAKKQKLIIITSVPDVAKTFFTADATLSQMQLITCDVTAIKTAARAVPT